MWVLKTEFSVILALDPRQWEAHLNRNKNMFYPCMKGRKGILQNLWRSFLSYLDVVYLNPELFRWSSVQNAWFKNQSELSGQFPISDHLVRTINNHQFSFIPPLLCSSPLGQFRDQITQWSCFWAAGKNQSENQHHARQEHANSMQTAPCGHMCNFAYTLRNSTGKDWFLRKC